jgi:hypothetical protein
VINNNNTIEKKHVKIFRRILEHKYILQRYNDKCFVKLNGKEMRELSTELHHKDVIEVGLKPKIFSFIWSVERELNKQVSRQIERSDVCTSLEEVQQIEKKSEQDLVSSVAPEKEATSEQVHEESSARTLGYEDLTFAQNLLTQPQTHSYDEDEQLQREKEQEYSQYLTKELHSFDCINKQRSNKVSSASNSFKQKIKEARNKRKIGCQSPNRIKHARISVETIPDSIDNPDNGEPSADTLNDQQPFTQFEPLNTANNFDHLIQNFNINALNRLQQLQKEVDALKSENQILKQQISNNESDTQQNDMVKKELLQEKLKFERLYETKLNELVLLKDEKRKLEMKFSDLQNNFKEREKNRSISDKKLQDMYLEVKQEVLEKNKLLEASQLANKLLQEELETLRKETDTMKKQINNIKQESERYKNQIKNREAHMAQTLRINMDVATKIEASVRSVLSDFEATRNQIVYLLNRDAERFALFKKDIFSQTALLGEDFEPKNTPPVAYQEQQDTDFMDQNRSVVFDNGTNETFLFAPQQTANSNSSDESRKLLTNDLDTKEIRTSLSKKTPRIGMLPMTKISSSNERKIHKVTFKDINTSTSDGKTGENNTLDWIKKKSKNILNSTATTNSSREPSTSTSKIASKLNPAEAEESSGNINFDNLSDDVQSFSDETNERVIYSNE